MLHRAYFTTSLKALATLRAEQRNIPVCCCNYKSLYEYGWQVEYIKRIPPDRAYPDERESEPGIRARTMMSAVSAR